jgi:hypothetical protein
MNAFDISKMVINSKFNMLDSNFFQKIKLLKNRPYLQNEVLIYFVANSSIKRFDS